MTPQRAFRTWKTLATRWYIPPLRSTHRRRLASRRLRRVQQGVLINFIKVEVINAITGEKSNGYMRDFTIKRLKQWLDAHNTRAEVERVHLTKNSVFSSLREDEFKGFPILIKLGRSHYPYLIDRTDLYPNANFTIGKPVAYFYLKTVDNLNYLESVAKRKQSVMELFKTLKSKKATKRTNKANKRSVKHPKKKRSR